jgi:hypothetical protein
MRALGTIIVVLILLYFLMLGMDYAASQGALFGFFEPVRGFLHVMYGVIDGFISFVVSLFH